MDTQAPLLTPTKRVCLFTGGSGTLGKAFCAAHAQDYHLVALYNTHLIPEALPLEAHNPSPDDPPHAIYSYGVNLVRFDLTQAMLHRIVQCFGQVDLLVHSAAVYNHHNTWLAQGALMPTLAIMEVNVNALLRLTTLLTRLVWRGNPDANLTALRNIVAVSSGSGMQFIPGGQELYSASKAALNMLTRHLAYNMKPFSVRVNAVCPDTFPERITTESVVEQIRTFDQGTMTGQIVPLFAPAPSMP